MTDTDYPVAIVTGAARGIGAAIASQIVTHGGLIYAVDIDKAALKKLQNTLGKRVRTVPINVTDESQVASVFQSVHHDTGRVDAVFANAGATGIRGPLEDTSVDDFRSGIDLLLTSVFLTFKHGVRIMRPQGRGSLVATSSVASIHGGLGPHIYTAAKHGVKGLVESTAVEISPYGLTANAIAPGGTVSSLSAGLLGDRDNTAAAYEQLKKSASSGKPTTSDDVANAAIFLALKAPSINGATLVIDGGDYVLPSSGRSHYTAHV